MNRLISTFAISNLLSAFSLCPAAWAESPSTGPAGNDPLQQIVLVLAIQQAQAAKQEEQGKARSAQAAQLSLAAARQANAQAAIVDQWAQYYSEKADNAKKKSKQKYEALAQSYQQQAQQLRAQAQTMQMVAVQNIQASGGIPIAVAAVPPAFGAPPSVGFSGH